MNRIDTWRNRLAWRICNWVLAHIAVDCWCGPWVRTDAEEGHRSVRHVHPEATS